MPNRLPQIQNYISTILEPKRSEMEELHRIILGIKQDCRLWFPNKLS